MAHTTGSDWTVPELCAYNFSVIPTSPDVSSNLVPTPSLDHLDPAILTSRIPYQWYHSNLSDATADYLSYLDLATHGTQECAIDFAAATLKLLGFNERNMTISNRYIIPLTSVARVGLLRPMYALSDIAPLLSYSSSSRTRRFLTKPARGTGCGRGNYSVFNITTRTA